MILIRIFLVLLTLCLPAKALAFPQVAATNTSAETANTTTHTVNLPSGIVAGDLLIVLIGKDGGGAVPGALSGFSSIGFGGGGGSGFSFGYSYKIATGSEGATVTFGTASAETSAHISYRITGWHGVTPPADSNAANSSSVNVLLNALNPSAWDIEDTLWLAFAVSNGNAVFSADPTGYTDPLEISSGGTTGGVTARSAQRAIRAASEDPDQYTLTVSQEWLSVVIGIRPLPEGFGRRAFRGGP